jgi:hypothetical protein
MWRIFIPVPFIMNVISPEKYTAWGCMCPTSESSIACRPGIEEYGTVLTGCCRSLPEFRRNVLS